MFYTMGQLSTYTKLKWVARLSFALLNVKLADIQIYNVILPIMFVMLSNYIRVALIMCKPDYGGYGKNQNHISWHDAAGDSETVLAMLVRLDLEITNSEKSYPSERYAVVTAELDILQQRDDFLPQEIREFDETNILHVNTESYAKTLHQIFVSLDLYRRPMLASENEDFIANVNRKEMRRLELLWLRNRQRELQHEQRLLRAQLLRTRALYSQLQKLLDSVWSNGSRPATAIEGALGRSHALRSALATVAERLRASVEYAQIALRLMGDALPAWKLASVAKNGWELTSACADACHVFIQARCNERGARRVLAAPTAPRAARSLRLALDYAFTDAVHDHKLMRGHGNNWRN